ncbi:hypothetical protein AMS68_006910 [Peltaster fructicola]|uniref:Phosphatidylinositol-specific phospholipase C X domain-containing protein n=1 Tax=Peltaster fructicola TaxID=286661 RepID=A0A6H0Y306_9PEZI|nr:hypothetical protein AMS68_006910 [Peltaster fructicola]
MRIEFIAGLLAPAALAYASCIDGPCNGNVDFCDRKYSNVSLIGAHDSAFVGPTSDLRVNQELNVTAQLNAGIRFLQAQVHFFNNELSMCHTSCAELYAGTLNDYLTSVKTWLDGNPNDVVSLLLVNGDNNNATQFASVFEAVGLGDTAFVPATTPNTLPINDWPTYEDMIFDDTRIVIYLDSGANEAEVPYLLTEFNYFFETPYDTTDQNFAECTLDRPAGSSPDGKMYIVNHFLDLAVGNTGILIPFNEADYTTNAATGNGSIGAQAALCTNIYGRVPNVVLVDFFDRGDVFTAQNNLNGVS